MSDIRILGEVVLCHKNSYKIVRRYLEGVHPELGIIAWGLSGKLETIQEIDIISPIRTVRVICDKN